jgi:hypothetical protein
MCFTPPRQFGHLKRFSVFCSFIKKVFFSRTRRNKFALLRPSVNLVLFDSETFFLVLKSATEKSTQKYVKKIRIRKKMSPECFRGPAGAVVAAVCLVLGAGLVESAGQPGPPTRGIQVRIQEPILRLLNFQLNAGVVVG